MHMLDLPLNFSGSSPVQLIIFICVQGLHLLDTTQNLFMLVLDEALLWFHVRKVLP
jgi:hypothetical protein